MLRMVKAGRYVSADGQYCIQRISVRRPARFGAVTRKFWTVLRWDDEHREFLPMNKQYDTLAAAREWVCGEAKPAF